MTAAQSGPGDTLQPGGGSLEVLTVTLLRACPWFYEAHQLN